MGGEPLDDTIAWECGFTVPFSESLAGEWASAVGSAATATGNADATCQAWVPEGYHFFNAAPTTVGEIREFRGGPADNRLWPDAFAGSDSATLRSVVSRVRRGTGLRHLRGVSWRVSIVVGHESGIVEPPPPGPPRIE